jgi:Tn3 transposase DDE domain
MTEWHQRYGGLGVMIYWHVERGSTCIYSQVGFVGGGGDDRSLLRQCTDAEIEAS